ncbi:hypothetical protein LSPH26S_03805 [Lysinibacillus sphaericus]
MTRRQTRGSPRCGRSAACRCFATASARWWSRSIIIEYLDQRHTGPVLADFLGDAEAALEQEGFGLHRFFDNYVQTPLQKIVFDRLCPAADRDAHCVRKARAMLETHPTPGLTTSSRAAIGPPAASSASPTVLPRRPCSMPTGPTAFRRIAST